MELKLEQIEKQKLSFEKKFDEISKKTQIKVEA